MNLLSFFRGVGDGESASVKKSTSFHPVLFSLVNISCIYLKRYCRGIPCECSQMYGNARIGHPQGMPLRWTYFSLCSITRQILFAVRMDRNRQCRILFELRTDLSLVAYSLSLIANRTSLFLHPLGRLRGAFNFPYSPPSYLSPFID